MRGMDNFFWHITKLHQSVIENRKKITVAIPAPVSGLVQQNRAFVTLGEKKIKSYIVLNQKLKISVKCLRNI